MITRRHIREPFVPRGIATRAVSRTLPHGELRQCFSKTQSRSSGRAPQKSSAYLISVDSWDHGLMLPAIVQQVHSRPHTRAQSRLNCTAEMQVPASCHLRVTKRKTQSAQNLLLEYMGVAHVSCERSAYYDTQGQSTMQFGGETDFPRSSYIGSLYTDCLLSNFLYTTSAGVLFNYSSENCRQRQSYDLIVGDSLQKVEGCLMSSS